MPYSLKHVLAKAVAGVLLCAPAAFADFTISTYKAAPEIINFSIADDYFTGALPQRFVGLGTTNAVDLFENGGNGQFVLNNPIPGLDQNAGVGDTDDFVVRA